VGGREAVGEALTGEDAGGAMSREKFSSGAPTLWREAEGNTTFGLLGQFDEHFPGVVQGRIVRLLPVQPIGQLAPGQVEQPNAPRAVLGRAALT
jgi:hypothetical protein